jgi:diguanylate cyclase (GGDEF)-like protein
MGRNGADRGIGRISAFLVVVVVLCTGAASYSYLHDLLVRDRSAILEAELERRAQQLKLPLRSHLQMVHAVAARSHTARALRVYQADDPDVTDRTKALIDLQGTAGNLVRGGRLRSAELQSLEGDKIASAAHMRDLPELSVPLPDSRAVLYWEDGFFIRARADVVGEEGVAGTLVVDLALEEADLALAITERLGTTGEVAVCGFNQGNKVCFPTRFRPGGRVSRVVSPPVLPTDRALSGERGTQLVMDHRGEATYSSFTPLAGFDLGLVVKVDEAELLAPMQDHLAVGLALLILLSAAGAVLIRLQLRPLTKELINARRRADAEVASRAAAEAEIRLANRRLQMVSDNASILIAFLDPQFVFRFANRAHAAWFHRPLDQIVGEPMEKLVGASMFGEYRSAMAAALASQVPQSVFRETSHGEASRFVEVTFVAQLDEIGMLEGYCITARDATETIMREKTLLLAARRDPLTGLCNRTSFSERLEQLLRRPVDSSAPLAVAYLDVDFFKRVNDTYGHDVGDELLKVVAERLQGTLKHSDTVARLGGDEFALILPEISAADDVYRVTDRLLESLRQPVVIDRHSLRITASVGFAVAVAGDTTASLLSRADKALYLVKRRGRNGALQDDHGVETPGGEKAELLPLTSE